MPLPELPKRLGALMSKIIELKLGWMHVLGVAIAYVRSKGVSKDVAVSWVYHVYDDPKIKSAAQEMAARADT